MNKSKDFDDIRKKYESEMLRIYNKQKKPDVMRIEERINEEKNRIDSEKKNDVIVCPIISEQKKAEIQEEKLYENLKAETKNKAPEEPEAQMRSEAPEEPEAQMRSEVPEEPEADTKSKILEGLEAEMKIEAPEEPEAVEDEMQAEPELLPIEEATQYNVTIHMDLDNRFRNKIKTDTDENTIDKEIVMRKEDTSPIRFRNRGNRIFFDESSDIKNYDSIFVASQAQNDTAYSSLIVSVHTANDAFPVKNATVIISRINDRNESEILYILNTDESGLTPTVDIAVPPSEGSLKPNECNGRCFAKCNILVSAKNFYKMEYIDVPVFENIRSIQNVNMIPLPAILPEGTSSTIRYTIEEPDI